MATHVRDQPEQQRYEIHEDGTLAGFLDYRRAQGRIRFTHTEVPEEFGGRGVARALVTAALDDARSRGLQVLPVCPYVRKVIAEDPGTYLDLVPEQARSAFDLGDVRETGT